jgi:hypothetical protein
MMPKRDKVSAETDALINMGGMCIYLGRRTRQYCWAEKKCLNWRTPFANVLLRNLIGEKLCLAKPLIVSEQFALGSRE